VNIKSKIGVVSCSGECCILGTLSRVATRFILEDVRADTVTLCLPLFLAGDSGERGFAQRFPTVSVDGCHKLCAKKAIEEHSGPTAASVDVEKLLMEWGEEPTGTRKTLSAKGVKLAKRIAQEVAGRVDEAREAQDG
jgi:uncharacterized metal-binding protein